MAPVGALHEDTAVDHCFEPLAKVATAVELSRSLGNSHSGDQALSTCVITHDPAERALLPMGVFKNKVFGMTGGLEREALTATIKGAGGSVSTIVHKRVSYLLCTPAAVEELTQRVRKAQKFGVPLVQPEFVAACVAAKKLVDYHDFSVEAPATVTTTTDDAATATATDAAS